MKNASQLFVGLLCAAGSALLVLAASTLALVEGGAISSVLPTVTQTQPVISITSASPGQTATVATPIPASPTTTATPACGKPDGWIEYTIQSGDTIDSLVAQSLISQDQFLKANCFHSASIRLEPGWVVYLPPSLSSSPTATATLTQSPEPPLPTVSQPTVLPTICGAPPGWLQYIVKPGDNLFRISLSVGISQQQLMTANCLNSTWIYVGQRLWVPRLPVITPVATKTPVPTNTPVPPTRTITPTSTPVQPGKQDQTINFAALPDKALGDPPFNVSATASSGLPVSFSATGACTVSGSTVNLTGVGSCAITASQPGNATFNPAPPVTRTFQVTRASQSISFPAPGGKTYGDPPFAVSASATSGLPVSFSASGSCSIAGNVVTLTSAGSCSITAAQDGDSSYLPAAPVTQTITVAPAGQTISFGALPNRTFGDPDFAVSASASSGLPVTFTASGSCTVAGNTVTMTAAGGCTITASQGGNSNYLAAADVAQSFQINP